MKVLLINGSPHEKGCTYTALSDPDDLKKMGILLDHLEDDDDVQNVWHNLENEEDLDR